MGHHFTTTALASACLALLLQITSVSGHVSPSAPHASLPTPRTALVLGYSTYFGGESTDAIEDIAIDDGGNIYVVGQTFSSNLKVEHPIQTFAQIGTEQYGNAFVAKITRDGSHIVYSTYLGGRKVERGMSIAVDRAGFAYVTGTTKSKDFPTKWSLSTSR